MIRAIGLACLLLSGSALAIAADEPKPDPKADEGNRVSLRRRKDKSVEVSLTSKRAFPPVNALPELHVGTQISRLSGYGESGDTHTIIFTLTEKEFEASKDGSPISVRYNPDSQGHWEFGKLDKSKIDK